METPEYYFNLGVESMQVKIAALVTTKGQIELATKILTLKAPQYLEPETISLQKKQHRRH